MTTPSASPAAPLRITQATPCAHSSGCPQARAFIARLGASLGAARPQLSPEFELSGALELDCVHCPRACRLDWNARADALDVTGAPGTASEGLDWRAERRVMN